MLKQVLWGGVLGNSGHRNPIKPQHRNHSSSELKPILLMESVSDLILNIVNMLDNAIGES